MKEVMCMERKLRKIQADGKIYMFEGQIDMIRIWDYYICKGLYDDELVEKRKR